MRDAPIAAPLEKVLISTRISKWNKILVKWGRSSTTLDISNKRKFVDCLLFISLASSNLKTRFLLIWRVLCGV